MALALRLTYHELLPDRPLALGEADAPNPWEHRASDDAAADGEPAAQPQALVDHAAALARLAGDPALATVRFAGADFDVPAHAAVVARCPALRKAIAAERAGGPVVIPVPAAARQEVVAALVAALYTETPVLPARDTLNEAEEVVALMCAFPAPLRTHLAAAVGDRALSDATIVVGEREIAVSAAIVAARVPFFRAALQAGFAEAESRRITIEDVGEAEVDAVLAFAYAADTEPARPGLLPALQAARQLAYGEFEEALKEDLRQLVAEDGLEAESYAAVLTWAREVDIPDIEYMCAQQVVKRLFDIQESETFLALDEGTRARLVALRRAHLANPLGAVGFENPIGSGAEMLAVLRESLEQMQSAFDNSSGLLRERQQEEARRSSARGREAVQFWEAQLERQAGRIEQLRRFLGRYSCLIDG